MLNKQNYYTDKNKYLTASKLKDYIFDPWYFYRKHILHEVHEDQTPSMVIGSAVDCLLTESVAAFEKKFIIVKRRSSDYSGKQIQINETEMERVMTAVEAVKLTNVYNDIIDRGFIAQKIIRLDKKIGIFDGVAGIPDWYYVSEDGICTIVDLKTTSSVESNKFRYAVNDFGYYLQQAFYQSLIMSVSKTPIVKCISYILAVETDATVSRVKLFKLDQNRIELEKDRISGLILEIAHRTVWQNPPLSWKDAEEL